MKKPVALFLVAVIYVSCGALTCYGGCVIEWRKDGPVPPGWGDFQDGSIPTQETSRTQQAALELLHAFNSMPNPPETWDGQCYYKDYLPYYYVSTCINGSWVVKECMWSCNQLNGYWDVFCNGTDFDHDGIYDEEDNCPDVYNPGQSDADSDGIGDACDNCPSVASDSQDDTDEDGAGDICDPCPRDAQNDSDGDGLCADADNCPAVYNPDQADRDNDGYGDLCDNCPDKLNPSQSDVDLDGIGDVCEYDPQCPDWSVSEHPIATAAMVEMWVSPEGDIFAVGWGNPPATGLITWYDGTEWASIITSIPSLYYGIWGTSRSDVFAMPNSGSIRHFNGSTWSDMQNPNISMSDIWGSSGTDVFVVGGSGRIIHYDGDGNNDGIPDSIWENMTSGTSQLLFGVWCASGTDVFAVGGNGTILHYDGTSWSAMASGTTKTLYAVWGSSASDIFAAGGAGTILHYDGSAWTAMFSGTSGDIFNVWGSSKDNVYAVGLNGMFRFDGTAWARVECSLLATPIRDVGGISAHEIFAVTGNKLFRYSAGATLVTLSSFAATFGTGKVILQWSTAAEIDTAGFNLYRAEKEDGNYVQINAALIPAKGSSTQGASYEFTDANVKNRKTYWYQMEDIDLSGKATMHGPVSATPRLIYGLK